MRRGDTGRIKGSLSRWGEGRKIFKGILVIVGQDLHKPWFEIKMAHMDSIYCENREYRRNIEVLVSLKIIIFLNVLEYS